MSPPADEVVTAEGRRPDHVGGGVCGTATALWKGGAGGGRSAPCSQCGVPPVLGGFSSSENTSAWFEAGGPQHRETPDSRPTAALSPQSFTGSALAALVKGLPEALQRQFEYEDPVVRGGKQLLHSPFFKVTWGPAQGAGDGWHSLGHGEECRSGPQKLPNRAMGHARPLRIGLLWDTRVWAMRIAGAGQGPAVPLAMAKRARGAGCLV